MAVLLAALSSLLWGTGDFVGGSVARRTHVLVIAAGSQLTGLALLLVVVVATRSDVAAGGLALGALAGLVGAGSLMVFYRALALGMMSLVAPVAAAGAVIPVLVAVAGGDDVSALAVAGMALAILGAVGCGLVPGTITLTRGALGLAATAAVGFGCFLALVQLGTQVAGSSGPGTILAARAAGAVTAVAAIVVSGRGGLVVGLERGVVGLVVAVGLLDVTANLLFAVASEDASAGAVVAVLGSLYPLATVLLARVVDGERLVRLQALSVVAALGGAALAGAG